MIQLFLNILFKLLSKFFSTVGKLVAPDWLLDLIVGLAKFTAIVNYYFPLGTLITVAFSVIGFHVILMIISAMLQLL